MVGRHLAHSVAMKVHELATPALVVDCHAFDFNLATMAAARPGAALRPHVKAHKCTAIADAQRAVGHDRFTCATPREVLGMAAAGLGADLLLANEVLDPRRLGLLAAAQSQASITVAVDSDATIDAAADAGIARCLVDVDVGLPRCGCDPADAGRLADRARARGLEVRGVMGYEGHLMVLDDRSDQADRVAEAMVRLRAAHDAVGGEIVSAGGTGTYDLHADTGVTEVQAGSYALMDTYYAKLGLPFRQALFVIGTVISAHPRYAVADVGLKALGMDHGNPDVRSGETEMAVWFCSDEHVTFAADDADVAPGDRVAVVPAHVDPTMTMHEVVWLVDAADPDAEVLDRWPIDLRGWGP
jgi:D-serine deaminase-like pyridoxal phosphate-dependent protein